MHGIWMNTVWGPRICLDGEDERLYGVPITLYSQNLEHNLESITATRLSKQINHRGNRFSPKRVIGKVERKTIENRVVFARNPFIKKSCAIFQGFLAVVACKSARPTTWKRVRARTPNPESKLATSLTEIPRPSQTCFVVIISFFLEEKVDLILYNC